MSGISKLFKRPSRPNRPPINIPPPIILPEPGIVEPPFYPPIRAGEPIFVASNVNPIGMSYWRNIGNHRERHTINIVLSINDELTFFTADKKDLTIKKEKELNIHHTGEGIYFSAIDPDKLFYVLGTTLNTINVVTGERNVVWTSEYNLWQCHTSYDDSIHSATLKDGNWRFHAWGVSSGQQYSILGIPDECQIDKSGKWLLIKEDNYNRIIYISTGAERIVLNEDGALGHSDNGFECAMGENDFSLSPGALDMINFINGEKHLIYPTGIWNMGYVSFCNAKPNKTGQICLVTTPTHLIAVNSDWPHESRIICDVLSESQEYEYRVKANLCSEGEFAIWTAFVSNSLNAYLVRV